MNSPPKPSTALLALLAAFIAVGPAATQLMLPALPAVQKTFDADISSVQLTVSLAFLVMAFATLVWGPASDRFGRRPVSIAGLALFITGNVVCWLAPTLPILILGRVMLATGAAAGGIVRAIVQDVYGPSGAARALSLAAMAMALAPMAAAVAGGFVTDAFGWRANFLGITAIGVVMLVLVVVMLGESRPALVPGRGSAWTPLRNGPFRLYALQSAVSMGAFFAFIAGAPYLIVTEMHLPASAYSIAFIAGGVGFALGNLLSSRLSPRQGIDRMVLAGAGVATLASLAMAFILASGLWSLWVLVISSAFVGLGVGVVSPNSQAGAVGAVPEAAGAAAGILGFLQFLAGSAVAQAVGVLMTHSALAMPFAIALLSAATLVLALPRAVGGSRTGSASAAAPR